MIVEWNVNAVIAHGEKQMAAQEVAEHLEPIGPLEEDFGLEAAVVP